MKTKMQKSITFVLTAWAMFMFASCCTECENNLTTERAKSASLQTALDECNSHSCATLPTAYQTLTPDQATVFMHNYSIDPSTEKMIGAYVPADLNCYIADHYNKDLFVAFGINAHSCKMAIYLIDVDATTRIYIAATADVACTVAGGGHGSTCPTTCPHP